MANLAGFGWVLAEYNTVNHGIWYLEIIPVALPCNANCWQDVQAAQEQSSRILLGLVILLIAALHAYLTARQILHPWSTKQAAYFIGDLFAIFKSISKIH